MISVRTVATIRIDADLVEVTIERSPWRARTVVLPGPRSAPEVALAEALLGTRSLRGGSSVRLRVVIETPNVVYSATHAEGDDVTVKLHADLLAALERVIGRRRTRGPATLELGPLVRAHRALACADRSSQGTGVIVDRSRSAVTVLVLDRGIPRWARSAPAERPIPALIALLERAAVEALAGGRIDWWALDDVADVTAGGVPGPPGVSGEAFAAQVATALGDLSTMAESHG